jgi:hypothetical protein
MRVSVWSAATAVVASAVLLVTGEAALAYTPQDGVIVAGNLDETRAPYGDNVVATASHLLRPAGLAEDPQGNLYFAEQGDNRVRKVSPDGILTSIAGKISEGGFSGDNGPALNAELLDPGAVATDARGNVYVADTGNYRIRKIDPNGIITTVAGTGGYGFSGDGGKATDAQIGEPDGLAVDAVGNLYIADGGRIRIVNPQGIINTYAGDGAIALAPVGTGAPVSPQTALSGPTALSIVGGDLYITEYADVRKIHLADGVITTVAGSWMNTPIGAGRGDGGPATQATFLHPSGASVDSHGNVFIADTGNYALREVTPDGIIRTVGSTHRNIGSLLVDGHDDVYYSDQEFDLIVKLGDVRVAASNVLPLPSNHACTSHRAFPIRVRRYRGITYTSATVAINGRRIPVYVYTTRRLKLTKVGAVYLNQRRFRAFIDLRGRAKGTYKVRVTATTSSGRVLAATRTYHTCSRSGRLAGHIPVL